MDMTRKTSVGIIGLGIIGSRVASSLRRSGFSVVVWNRSPRAEPNFLASAREVAESADFLQLFVRDGDALMEVIAAMSPVLGEHHIVMNHATVSPAETVEAERLVHERGAAFLDVPFTGSRDAAAEGQLVYYAGGDPSVLERAMHVLEASAKAVLPMGPVGAATYVKVATNMISAATVEVLSEALAFLDRGGVSLLRLREAVEHNVASSGVISAKLPLMLTGEFDPRFSVKNMLKDLQIALRFAEGHGVELPATAATAGALMGAVQAGWGDDDFASLARHYPYSGSIKDLPVSEPFTSSSPAPRKPNKRKKASAKPARKSLLDYFRNSSESPS